MNTFKKIALTLVSFAMLAVNSYALQCSGTLVVQLPSGWTTTYLVGLGQFVQLTGTTSDGWTTFNLTTSMGSQYQTEFVLSASSSSYTAPVIAQNAFNGSNVNDGVAFTCSQLNAAENNTLYIYENPISPGSTVVSDSPLNAYYFYFLPPNKADWLTSTPHLALIIDGDTTLAPMLVDPYRCGWYRLVYFSEEPPSSPAIIYSSGDRTPKDKVGILGVDEDYPTTFSLMERFNDLSTKEIFFAAQRGSAGWTATDPLINESERCIYDLAFIIYMHAVGGSFSQYPDTGACGSGEDYSAGYYGHPIRGIVKNTLDENRKMVIDSNMIGEPSGWCTADQFNNAFKFTEGYNVEVCYFMPFERVANGNWEFDSDRMTNPEGLLVGGFFPHVVYSPYLENYGRGMDQCVGCLTEHDISASPTIITQSNNGSFAPVTWRGVTHSGIDAFDRTDAEMLGNTFVYNHGNRITGRSDDMVRPLNDTWTDKGRNHICFESHSEFTYNGGEEFFFRGDDDIWVFINNRLVIDLGGNHEALPGYVDLDTIGGCIYSPEGSNNLSCANANENRLVKGQKYNIDIFFCDRRGPNSNVRVSTTMYLEGNLGYGSEICNALRSPIKETRYANPQISFSLKPLLGNYFQISFDNFENMRNAKIDVYNLKGNLVNSVAVNSSQMQIKVPASGFYIFNLNGPGISPKTTIGVAR